MPPRIRLFHWKIEEAAPLIAKLRGAGYAVDHGKTPTVRQISESAPAAVVIDLSRIPSHGRAVGAWLRGSKSTRDIPLVFVGGDAAKVAALRQEIPDAVYTTLAGIRGALKRAIATPPPVPVVPRQMMEGYGHRTTAQKLGIREGSSVGLIDPPADYLRVLGALPPDAVIEEDPARACDVTLWFVQDASEYAARLRDFRTRKKLWIVWRKGRRDGLNGNFVREEALALGLVDYKICSLDGVWSGMAFTTKKASSARPT
jgi:hypothetical protein